MSRFGFILDYSHKVIYHCNLGTRVIRFVFGGFRQEFEYFRKDQFRSVHNCSQLSRESR